MIDFKKIRIENNFSQEDFANYFGCKQSFISQIERGIRTIPDEYISKLKADLNIKGMSENFETARNSENFLLIPLYSQDVVGGVNNQEMDTNGYVTGYMPFVNAKQNDICVPVTNDSMAPLYSPGTIVQIRKLEYWKEFVEFGKVHIIELNDDRRLIKIIRKGDDSNHFILKSENPKYDDADISIDFIRSVWLVLAKYQKVVM